MHMYANSWLFEKKNMNFIFQAKLQNIFASVSLILLISGWSDQIFDLQLCKS